ncbi:MAG TPA: preprotein translocase subunit SecG [Cryomorphaceae bacterium]|nr:preprotein translocase subunit SecG [Owenweeksia sp.]HAD97034.1 preprotein translocase subunit SecG [Cryomorphaceae bacterium]HBF21523.1 preprotein translocase subunit SecG [Cryomorphaceae bacterium]|tara:strand:- start:110 stop:499 length:390 start_codon:yes stop_codon:yes gene_type:complete
MTMLFSVLIIITCVLLILIVLIQNPKGGGLSSSFGGGGTQLFGGVKKTTDFLDRGTWALAVALVVLVLAANVVLNPMYNSAAEGNGSRIEEELNTMPQASPVAPPPAQGQGQMLQEDMPTSVDEDGGDE